MGFVKFELLDTAGDDVIINTNYILYVLPLNVTNSQITMRDGTTISVEDSVDDVEFAIKHIR